MGRFCPRTIPWRPTPKTLVGPANRLAHEARYQAVIAVIHDGWKITEVAERIIGTRTGFGGGAEFSNAAFEGAAYFDEVRFLADVFIDGAAFSDLATFSFCEARGNVSFGG